MNWKRILAGLVVCILMALIMGMPQAAQAAVEEGMAISPRYRYTREVMADLSISSSGTATCTGAIAVYNTTSDISMRVNLYKKVGSSWIKEVGWTNSCEGRYSLSIEETYTVTAGTYKVVTTGAIIGADGDYETVSVSSAVISYP